MIYIVETGDDYYDWGARFIDVGKEVERFGRELVERAIVLAMRYGSIIGTVEHIEWRGESKTEHLGSFVCSYRMIEGGRVTEWKDGRRAIVERPRKIKDEWSAIGKDMLLHVASQWNDSRVEDKEAAELIAALP